MLYQKIIEQDKKVTKLLGIPIYTKTMSLNHCERKYFGGIYKTKVKDYVKRHYIFGIEIFKTSNRLEVLEKRLDDIFYQQQVLIKIPTAHSYFKQFKNCNAGKNTVLVAGGPTLNFYNRQINSVHCGVNGIVKIVNYLNYLFSVDDPILDADLRKEYINYKGEDCIKFFGILPQRRLKVLNSDIHFTERILPETIEKSNAYAFYIEDVLRNKWAIDLEHEAFGDFEGAVFFALQFLLYTNPKRIYLVGNDCTKGNAYNSGNYVAGNNAFKIKYYKILKNINENVYPNTEIISINPVGLKGLFRDVYTKEYVKTNPEKFKYMKEDDIEYLEDLEKEESANA